MVPILRRHLTIVSDRITAREANMKAIIDEALEDKEEDPIQR